MTATHISILLVMVIGMIGFYVIVKFLFKKMERNTPSFEMTSEIVEKIDHWIEYIISITPDAISSVNEDKKQDDEIDKGFELDSENKKTSLDQSLATPSAPKLTSLVPDPLPVSSREPDLFATPEAIFERPSDHYQLPLQLDEKS